VKNIQKVRAYFKELMSGKNKEKFDQLTEYLTSEI